VTAAAAAEGAWPLATAAMTMSCPLLGASFCISGYIDDSEDESDEQPCKIEG
jgi:hypothetical protein